MTGNAADQDGMCRIQTLNRHPVPSSCQIAFRSHLAPARCGSARRGALPALCCSPRACRFERCENATLVIQDVWTDHRRGQERAVIVEHEGVRSANGVVGVPCSSSRTPLPGYGHHELEGNTRISRIRRDHTPCSPFRQGRVRLQGYLAH